MPATYESIATTTISGTSTNQVTFNSISGSYTDIVLVANFGVTTATANIYYRVNNDSGTNYSNTNLNGTGSSATSTRASSANRIYADSGGSTTSVGSTLMLQFMNYSNTTTNKTILARFGNASYGVYAGVGLWRSTAAITRIDAYIDGHNFADGSTLTLYGIKAA